MAALDFPATPTNGQTYTSGTSTWVYNSTKGIWSIVSSGQYGYTGSQGGIGYTGSVGYTGSKGTTQTGTTAPVSAANGDQWWDTETGNLYVYYDDGTSSQWVQQSLGSSVAGGNTNIQFNDSGTIAGSANLTFDKTTSTLKINSIEVPNIITTLMYQLAF